MRLFHLKLMIEYMKNNVQVYKPAELVEAEIQDCLSVIKEGGALINSKTAVNEFPHSAVIAIKRVKKKIVGVGVIKQKRPKYASDIAKKSRFQFDNDIHEFGYVAVKKSHRRLGFSHEITTKLLATFQSRPLFATTSNEYMKPTLKKAGFIQHGDEWQGKKGKLSLWIIAATNTKIHN